MNTSPFPCCQVPFLLFPGEKLEKVLTKVLQLTGTIVIESVSFSRYQWKVKRLWHLVQESPKLMAFATIHYLTKYFLACRPIKATLSPTQNILQRHCTEAWTVCDSLQRVPNFKVWYYHSTHSGTACFQLIVFLWYGATFMYGIPV